MLAKVGQYKFAINAYLTDFRGKATLPMIGGFMLEVATKHAEDRGFGYAYMMQKKRVWVLSRIIIEMLEYPKNDSTIVVNTWISNVNRLFTERLFSFEDDNGREIGFARSLWACIDMDTRKPTNILDLEGMTKFVHDQKKCPIEGMSKISNPSVDSESVDSFKIKYSDIDINKHLNSMKYIEHFVDIFDLDDFKEKEINRIEISYLAEGKYGSNINIVQTKENDSTFILAMNDGETTISTSRITWK